MRTWVPRLGSNHAEGLGERGAYRLPHMLSPWLAFADLRVEAAYLKERLPAQRRPAAFGLLLTLLLLPVLAGSLAAPSPVRLAAPVTWGPHLVAVALLLLPGLRLPAWLQIGVIGTARLMLVLVQGFLSLTPGLCYWQMAVYGSGAAMLGPAAALVALGAAAPLLFPLPWRLQAPQQLLEMAAAFYLALFAPSCRQVGASTWGLLPEQAGRACRPTHLLLCSQQSTRTAPLLLPLLLGYALGLTLAWASERAARRAFVRQLLAPLVD